MRTATQGTLRRWSKSPARAERIIRGPAHQCAPPFIDTPTNLGPVTYTIVDPRTVPATPGPHPAASPFDKRVSEALGITAFEVYTVELPPDAETVRHDHLDDGVEDLYFIVAGDGWLLVDDDSVSLRPGIFVAVTVESTRALRGGRSGLSFVATCGRPH